MGEESLSGGRFNVLCFQTELFFKNVCQKLGGKHHLYKDVKPRTAWAG